MCVSEFKCVRVCVCVSIISKRLTLCYCAALLCCENNWIKFKCFCCIICSAYYCYLFKLAITTTTATTKATQTRVLKAVNKTKQRSSSRNRNTNNKRVKERQRERIACMAALVAKPFANPRRPLQLLLLLWRACLQIDAANWICSRETSVWTVGRPRVTPPPPPSSRCQGKKLISATFKKFFTAAPPRVRVCVSELEAVQWGWVGVLRTTTVKFLNKWPKWNVPFHLCTSPFLSRCCCCCFRYCRIKNDFERTTTSGDQIN